jgi:hypothetical protein
MTPRDGLSYTACTCSCTISVLILSEKWEDTKWVIRKKDKQKKQQQKTTTMIYKPQHRKLMIAQQESQ